MSVAAFDRGPRAAELRQCSRRAQAGRRNGADSRGGWSGPGGGRSGRAESREGGKSDGGYLRGGHGWNHQGGRGTLARDDRNAALPTQCLTNMPAIAALSVSRSALLALRRTIPRGGPSVVSCRSPAALHRLLQSRLVDVVVLAPQQHLLAALSDLRSHLPSVPVVAYAPFRPDDGDLLLACRVHSVAAVLVEGVDDPVAGDLVLRSSITAERRRALID